MNMFVHTQLAIYRSCLHVGSNTQSVCNITLCQRMVNGETYNTRDSDDKGY